MKSNNVYYVLIVTGMLMSSCLNSKEIVVPESDTDSYRSKVFSFENIPEGPLKKHSERSTHFETIENYSEKVADIYNKLQNDSYTKDIPHLLDYACNELLLAIYHELGNVSVRDSIVMSKTVLMDNCTPVENSGGLAKSAATVNPPTEVSNRQYPYKMIGKSWRNWDIGVYRSTGGETFFHKKRSIWGTTKWWGLDAERIGVRSYFFSCPSSSYGTVLGNTCFHTYSNSDWDKYDDAVQTQHWAAGGVISFSLNGWLPTGLKYLPELPYYSLYKTDSYYTNGGREIVHLDSRYIDWTNKFLDETVNIFFADLYAEDFIDWVNRGSIPRIPAIEGYTDSYWLADAVLSMHSVRHGSRQFTAISSSGLKEHISVKNISSFDFVSW